jgi:hypothetical protein
MAFEDRIEALRMKHHALEEELDHENQRPAPDDAAIARMKKEKLRLKDEIERLAHV